MNVNPVKLPYRGVLIERPCVHCETVDVHFEGRCNSGPCVQCGENRYVTTRYSGTWGHDSSHDHKWLAHEYFPAQIVFAHNAHDDTINCEADKARKAFDTIIARVAEIGWPELYTCDLFSDYKAIAGLSRWSPVPLLRFVWSVRSTGTDLFSPEQGIFGGYEAAKDRRFFAYDGRTHGPLGDFPEINIDTARSLLSIWRAQDLQPVQRITDTHECYVTLHAPDIDTAQEQRDTALLGLDPGATPLFDADHERELRQ